MRTLGRWLRLVTGAALGLVLLALAPRVLAAGDGLELELLASGLGLVGFALLAAGWGAGARWPGAAGFVRAAGLTVFGVAMTAFVVVALSVPGWLQWLLFALFAAAAAAFPLWILRGRGQGSTPVERDVTGRLVVPGSRGPLAMLAVLGAAMATGSAALLSRPGVGWVVGVVGLGFFGGASLWLAFQAARRGPALRADDTGVEDRSSLAAAGRIAWHELASVRATSTYGQPVVALTPRDWYRVVERQPAWKRWLLTANRRLTHSDDLFVNVSALPCGGAELAGVLEAMRLEHG